MIQAIKNLLKAKQPVDFITVADVARQRRCDVRTVGSMITRGVLPPLVGNQRGLAATDKGWDRIYWDEWFRLRAARDEAAEFETIGNAG